MNFLKNISAVTWYFVSMVSFLIGYLFKNTQPILYLIGIVFGLIL